jgi:hypothetical protein
VRLVFDQDGVQVYCAEDHHSVEELAAKGADEPSQVAFISGVWTCGAQDPGAGGPEDGIERGGEVRSAVADQKLDVLEPVVEAEGQVAGLLQ